MEHVKTPASGPGSCVSTDWLFMFGWRLSEILWKCSSCSTVGNNQSGPGRGLASKKLQCQVYPSISNTVVLAGLAGGPMPHGNDESNFNCL